MREKLERYRFLFEELVKRDFKKKYKGTVLGMAWSVLNPLLTLLVMKLVFTYFFGRDVPHYSIYIFSGNIIYMYFSDATSQGMTSLVSNASIISKVTVPKQLFILAKNAQTFINFCLTVLVYFIYCLFDRITFTWKFLLLLYPIVLMPLLNFGVGMILSALYVFFRDMTYLWNVCLRLIMYLSAIFYTIDRFPEAAQKAFLLNPLYLFIRYFRMIVIDSQIPGIGLHLLMLFDVFVVMCIGLRMYRKYNTEFLYYI